jgi:hypothetical protein
MDTPLPPRLGALTLDPELLREIPGHLILRYRAVPLRLEGTRLVVGMVNPDDLMAREDLGLLIRYTLEVEPIDPDLSDVQRYLDESPSDTLLMHDYSAEDFGQKKGEPEFPIDPQHLRQILTTFALQDHVEGVFLLALQRQARQFRVACRPDRIDFYFGDDLHPELTKPRFVRQAFWARWKEQAGLDLSEPEPCSGRLKGGSADWTVQFADEAVFFKRGACAAGATSCDSGRLSPEDG